MMTLSLIFDVILFGNCLMLAWIIRGLSDNNNAQARQIDGLETRNQLLAMKVRELQRELNRSHSSVPNFLRR